jgi:hypothetical protein
MNKDRTMYEALAEYEQAILDDFEGLDAPTQNEAVLSFLIAAARLDWDVDDNGDVDSAFVGETLKELVALSLFHTGWGLAEMVLMDLERRAEDREAEEILLEREADEEDEEDVSAALSRTGEGYA